MKLFKLQKSLYQTNSAFSNDFKKSNCRCLQQELIMSIVWMDLSNFKNAKKMLKIKSIEMRKIINKSKSQMDLFE